MKYKIFKVAFWSFVLIAIASESIAVGQVVTQLPQNLTTPSSVIIEIALTAALGVMAWMGKKLYNNLEINQTKHETFMEKLNDKCDKSIVEFTERISKLEQKNADCKSCNG